MTYTVTPAQFRATAHKIADVIYEKLTGDPGVFSTRIAYITKQGSRFQLLVADADGVDPQTIVTQQRAAAVAALVAGRHAHRLRVVRAEEAGRLRAERCGTGARQAVANFRGSNSAPAWSPDGRRLAVTLTKDGGSQLYVMNADGSDVAARDDVKARRSTPRRTSRRTATRCCSRPTAAAVRRSIA